MEYFLESIAGSIHKEFGNALNRHCLVFPNRRAGLYFLKHLATKIDKPVWSPAIYTINELFRSYSSLQIAGNEILLFELYKIYRKIKKTPESFDDFYFWGDILLNDFDDADKYLVDASKLFRNISDIKNIDREFGELTAGQKDIIKRFWVNFATDKPTNEKSGFIDIWSILYDLYINFRNSLREQNLAYEGMIFRDLSEKTENKLVSDSQWEMIHFIGFNALNSCEKRVMTLLKDDGRARFYWDYCNSYIKDGNINSAGFFMRNNLRVYGNDMPEYWNYNTALAESSDIIKRTVIETSSDVAQVKMIPKLIREIPGLTPENAHHTAVVLADENLLMPVLTSLPGDTGDINITMGYPLKQTVVYTFLRHLMDLQTSAIISEGIVYFSISEVKDITRHSLLEGMLTGSDETVIGEINKRNVPRVQIDIFESSELLSRIFKKISEPASLSVYFKEILSLVALNDRFFDGKMASDIFQRNIRNEFIYRIILSLNRLESILGSSEISFTADTYIRMLDRMLRSQSVPFSGEPLSGIQIMGILETRALDFKNLIILSVNESVLPAVSMGSSFIPFSLREAFGLPSLNHQESIYAYHFYRLLERAENVTFLYNSNSEGLRSGEMSRFLIQMKYEEALRPEFLNLSFEIQPHSKMKEKIERTNEHCRKLEERFLSGSTGKILSPSAINTWLNCRMKFYYRYVNNLKEPDRITEDIDAALLGNILHEIMRCLYCTYLGKVLSAETLERLINDNFYLENTVQRVINDKIKNGQEGYVRGNELIVKDVLLAYIRRILQADKSLAPITVLHLEEPVEFSVTIPGKNGIMVRTGGIVDRVDIVSGSKRIIDYKTGSVSESICSMEDLFIDGRKKDSDGWLQALIYSEAIFLKDGSIPIRPSIYKIRKMAGGSFSDQLRLKTSGKGEIPINDYREVRDEFLTGLQGVILKIFDPDEPFVMTKDISGKCQYCQFRMLCMR